ncbi:sulfate permease [Vagococcus martis]|uniref:Sulfate permease n=1 Tax=Vagococcus martis TaxID=1768210 RepID=A0A1V4DFN6_9ENTE|nr:SulP family inorganic anion transporter [Vagococcus martis]OPF87285.1 sulfate permease [Vagococcus martis]
MLLSIKENEWVGNPRENIFAGLVSSVAILPEVIGFAIIAGVHPMSALFASAITLLVITLTGGRPAMVSAAAGSMALVIAGLVQSHGLNYMIAATILTGIFQFILGYLNIHKIMKYIPKSVMIGFVNGLAISIFLAQVQQLPEQNVIGYVMVIVSILAIYLLPKVIKVVPPALIIITVMTILSFFFKGSFFTVGDLGDMSSLDVSFGLPLVPMNLETLWIILPTAISLTFIGLMETLLTVPIVDEMTHSTSDSKREVKAQGLANFITGLFGGQAGCAMIGQAVINVKSGGRTRLSTFVSGTTLLLFIFVLNSLIMMVIPTAALIGIMITVAGDTFDWKSLQLVKSWEMIESTVMVVTVVVIVYTGNLAIGILCGVILNGLLILLTKLNKK